MNYKKYTFIVVAILFFLVVYNGIIWQLYSKKWFAPTTLHVGDLSRLGYLPEAASPRETYTDLPRLHKETSEINSTSQMDIAVIGDSFAGEVSGGKNPSFTDYISTRYGKNVLRVGDYPGTNNEMETIVLLCNSGFFDKLHTKIVIIESTERLLARRFAVDMNWDKTDSLNNIMKTYQMQDIANTNDVEVKSVNSHDGDEKINETKVGFINNGNFKFIINKIIYLFTDTSPLTNVVIMDVNQSLFSTQYDKKLLNFKRDVRMKEEQEEENIAKINHNFDELSLLLSKRGITLIFMPIASKYTIYEPYIVNNTFPKDTFFQKYEALPKKHYFINTQKILSNAMPIKDLYYGDDTHWSYKASDLVISSKIFDDILQVTSTK